MDKAVVSRLFIGNQKFEILVDPQLALRFKKGERIDLKDVLAYPVIYHDTRSTEAVSASALQKSFGTTDVMKIASKIILEGELQLTTEQRKQMIEQKKKQVADLISKRGINPQTNAPHPPQRILNVIEQSGVSIDPFMDAELQIEKVVKAIKQFLPIKFQKVTLQVKVPAQFAGKVFPILKSTAVIQQEQWLSDGSLQATLEVLAGLQENLTRKIAELTHGQYETKVLKREDA